jgi:heat shock protein HtpX
MRASYRIEAVALLLAIAAIAALCAWLIWGGNGIWLALGIIGFGYLFAPKLAPAMALQMFRAIPMAPDLWPDEYALVYDISRRAGLSAVPALYRLPTDVGMAFSTGSADMPVIAISSGALSRMSQAELAGIFAHEIAHLVSGDITLRTLPELMARFTRILSLFGALAALWLTITGAGQVALGALAILVVAPTAIALLQLALSRNREYEADAFAVAVTGDPNGLASALRLLEEEQHSLLRRLFWPHARGEVPGWLRTHPRTEERIARLRASRPQDFRKP